MTGERKTIVRRVPRRVDWGQVPALSLLDYIEPDDLEPRNKTYVVSGPQCVRHLAVTGFPSSLRFGYLSRLFTGQPGVHVVQWIKPVPHAEATPMLGRSRRAARATIDDANDVPEAEVGLSDIERLRLKVARGEERLIYYGIYIQLCALSPEELERRTETVLSQLRALGLEVRRCSFQQKQAFDACLPAGVDVLGQANLVDTSSVARGFFLTSSSISLPNDQRPVFYGLTVGRDGSTGGQVLFNPFHSSLTNPHAAVLAKTGGGKSYLLKYELIQSLIHGRRYIVIDPEHEYEHLAQELGGTFVRIAPGSLVRVNPFDLPPEAPTPGGGQGNALGEKVATLSAWLEAVFSPGRELTPAERGELEEAIRETYAASGIGRDGRAPAGAVPVLEDLVPHLSARLPDLAPALVHRLEGALSMFNGPTNVDTGAAFVVFGFREVSTSLDKTDELKGLAAMLAFERVWTYARSRPHPDQDPITVLLDEAWTLVQSSTGGRLLDLTVRRGRKYNLRLVLATQQVRDVITSNRGQTLIGNCHLKFLLEMEPSEVELAQKVFDLTPGEADFLRRCGRTEEYNDGLLLLGRQRTGLRVLRAPATMHRLISTKPGAWGGAQG